MTRYGHNRIAASIDVRDGQALGEGWREGAPGVPVVEAIAALAAGGRRPFEVTAIDRDGLLGGPDLELLRRLVGLGHGRIIASGGIASIADVIAVQAAGCAGAIVGRALYEGRIDLRELCPRGRRARCRLGGDMPGAHAGDPHRVGDVRAHRRRRGLLAPAGGIATVPRTGRP